MEGTAVFWQRIKVKSRAGEGATSIFVYFSLSYGEIEHDIQRTTSKTVNVHRGLDFFGVVGPTQDRQVHRRYTYVHF
jgi:hypothetical protein